MPSGKKRENIYKIKKRLVKIEVLPLRQFSIIKNPIIATNLRVWDIFGQ